MRHRISTCALAAVLVTAACADSPLAPVGAPAPITEGELLVTTSSPDGPGSLGAALEAANVSAMVTTIRFERGIDVALQQPIVLTGSQPIMLDGRGATFDASGLSGDAIIATGGADLTLRNFTVKDAPGNGIFVEVPAGATGVQKVTLDGVTIEGSGLHGLHIDDQITYSEFDPNELVNTTGSDSPAGLDVVIRDSRFLRNGIDPNVYDFDGVRVDEGGDGDLVFLMQNSLVEGNYGDGVELDEIGNGDVDSKVQHTDFIENGDQPQNEDDLEDGFDIDEAGPGSIYARFVGVTSEGHEDENIDLDEDGPGDIIAWMTDVVAKNALDANIQFSEDASCEDDPSCTASGNIELYFDNVLADGSRDDDGIKIEEFGPGDIDGRIVHSTFSNNHDDGIQIEQLAAGGGLIRLQALTFFGNGDDDINIDDVEWVQVP